MTTTVAVLGALCASAATALAQSGTTTTAAAGGATYHGAATVSHTTNIASPYATAETVVTSATPTVEGAAGAGGQVFNTPNPSDRPMVDGYVAVILPDGRAAAPSLAPAAVQKVIWAGNQIIGLPYRYGGGHRTVAHIAAAGYDCSGAVSFALGKAKLLKRPMDSTEFLSWGLSGQGDWMTVYTNPAHAYLEVAGIRLDTSAAGDLRNQKGPRWRPLLTSHKGFKKRHPVGL